jgi:hypothetical protein
VARTFHIGLYRSRQFEEYNREKQGDEKAPKTILKRVKFLFFLRKREEEEDGLSNDSDYDYDL